MPSDLTNNVDNKNLVPHEEDTVIQNSNLSLVEVIFIFVVTIFVVISFTIGSTYFKAYLDIRHNFLIMEVLLIVPALVYTITRRFSLVKIFKFNPITLNTVVLSIIMGVSAIFIVNYIEYLVSFLPFPDWYINMKSEAQDSMTTAMNTNSIGDFAQLFVIVAIIASVVEEMIFRGMLQRTLENKYHFVSALVITAVCFTILHPANLISIFILAIFLGILSWKSNSIYPSIIVHILNNGISLTVLTFSDSALQVDRSNLEPPFLLLFLMGLILFYSSKKFLNLEKY